MNQKKVTFATKPHAGQAADADAWVANRADHPQPEKVKLKRLTLDLPPELHARIKAACATKGITMTEDVTKLLEREYPDP